MRPFSIGRRFKSFVTKSCSRWSIFAAVILYVGLFTFIMYMRIPLKSDNNQQNAKHGEELGDNNIVEYLHRLHNLKPNQEITEEETDRLRPFRELEDMFHKADTNKDKFLNLKEITMWINLKTQEHIREAVVESYNIFVEIDVNPKNGQVSWTEYHHFFLEKNGVNKTYIMDHAENHKPLPRNMKEAIMRDKAAWSECAKTNPDYLTLNEFLSFRHPESSYSTMISIVDEIFKKFDRDQDDYLTEEEFSSFQSEDDFIKSEALNQEEEERRREFQEEVDLNKDGKATRKEMLAYIDPKNMRHAAEEAENLMALADINGDGRLSLKEVFLKTDLFLGSKMIDTGKNFHDEF